MNRPVAALTVALTVLVTAVNGYPADRQPPLEDQPGWNCHIHGNRVCGQPQNLRYVLLAHDEDDDEAEAECDYEDGHASTDYNDPEDC